MSLLDASRQGCARRATLCCLRLALLASLVQPLAGAFPGPAQAASPGGVPVPAPRPAPKADFVPLGKALTGGPYLDLMLATEYQPYWTPRGSDARYSVVFSRPINLPAGCYALRSKDSHAHYAGPGKPDRGLAVHRPQTLQGESAPTHSDECKRAGNLGETARGRN